MDLSALRLPRVGDTLAGKYAIEREVGAGGMAVVFEATHLRMRQRVALKMLHPTALEFPDIPARFEREARAIAQLFGPHVARILDVDATPEGLPYMVMEYLDGVDLADEMSRRGALPVGEAVSYLLQACTAMHEAHALSIVHRDLKPANLFLCGAEGARMVKVLDFGVSKILEETTGVTATRIVLGTPAYMSPEQMSSSRDVDARTDIWSLGVILYEAIAGQLPFEGKSPAALANAILHDEVVPLAQLRADLPLRLSEVVATAMSRDLGARWPDVGAFAQALAPFAPEGKWEPAPPPSLRRPSRRMRLSSSHPPASLRPSASRVPASELVTQAASAPAEEPPRASDEAPSPEPAPPPEDRLTSTLPPARDAASAVIPLAWVALALAVLAIVLFVATR